MDHNRTETEIDKEKTGSAIRIGPSYLLFIFAGLMWLTGFLFLLEISLISIWWFLLCFWFPLFCVMMYKFPRKKKYWVLANNIAVLLLLLFPFWLIIFIWQVL